MKKIRIFVLLLMILIIGSCTYAYADSLDDKVLRVGYIENFEPLSGVDERGNPNGICVDVVKRICDNASIPITFIKLQDHENIEHAIRDRNLDMIAGMDINYKSNNYNINFTKPYFYYDFVMVSKRNLDITKENSLTLCIDDLYKKEVANIVGSQNKIKVDKITYYNNGMECVQAVKDSDQDIAILCSYEFNRLQQFPQYKNMKYATLSGYTKALGIGVIENNDDVVAKLNKSFDEVGSNTISLIITEAISDSYEDVRVEDFVNAYFVEILALVCVLLAIAISVIVNKKRSTEYWKIAKELQFLLDNMPGGYYKSKEGFKQEVNQASLEFYNIIGYTEKEFEQECNNAIENIIIDEDIEKIKAFLKELEGTNKLRAEEYRIKTKDGKIKWIYDVGKRHVENGESWIYSSVFDFTERRELVDEARMSEEKVRYLLNATDSIYFEMDASNGNTHFSNTAKRTFDIPLYDGVYMDSKDILDLIHPEDKDIFLFSKERLDNGELHVNFNIRFRTVDKSYRWFKARTTVIRDLDGKVEYYLGHFVDTNEEVVELDEIRKKAEKDLLTGLLNKKTFEENADIYIQTSMENFALAVIDLDDFKAVNDKYGHLCGDKVLAICANRIEKVCKRTDIVGRIGGDEFAIMFKDVGNGEFLYKKVDELLTIFKEPIKVDRISINQGISIGVAISQSAYSMANYLKAYEEADRAMYISKNTGKNKGEIIKIK